MASTHRHQVAIRVRGMLPASWSAVLAGLSLEDDPDGTTTIRGEVADEAALHGVLASVRDLGLPVVSIESRIDPAERRA